MLFCSRWLGCRARCSEGLDLRDLVAQSVQKFGLRWRERLSGSLEGAETVPECFEDRAGNLVRHGPIKKDVNS
jgi:hypothetical protein